jgi:integrase
VTAWCQTELFSFPAQRLRPLPREIRSAATFYDLSRQIGLRGPADAVFEDPSQSGLIQRVLAMRSKRYEKKLISFLTRPEIDAVLAAPDRNTWAGRRDHTFLLVAVQTGLRLSEMTGLRREDIVLETGAHVHCLGKGRKQRCTPLTKQAVSALKLWFQQPRRGDGQIVFPNARGTRLSPDGVQYLLAKHVAVARERCPALNEKRVTPHCLRHYGRDGTLDQIAVLSVSVRLIHSVRPFAKCGKLASSGGEANSV